MSSLFKMSHESCQGCLLSHIFSLILESPGHHIRYLRAIWALKNLEVNTTYFYTEMMCYILGSKIPCSPNLWPYINEPLKLSFSRRRLDWMMDPLDGCFGVVVDFPDLDHFFQALCIFAVMFCELSRVMTVWISLEISKVNK